MDFTALLPYIFFSKIHVLRSVQRIEMRQILAWRRHKDKYTVHHNQLWNSGRGDEVWKNGQKRAVIVTYVLHFRFSHSDYGYSPWFLNFFKELKSKINNVFIQDILVNCNEIDFLFHK